MDAFKRVLFEPFDMLCKDPSKPTTCMTFIKLFGNSLLVALGTSVLAVAFGASAAYAFSRFKFIGRQIGMLGFIILNDAANHCNTGSFICTPVDNKNWIKNRCGQP